MISFEKIGPSSQFQIEKKATKHHHWNFRDVRCKLPVIQISSSLTFQVIASTTVRGWLDASLESKNWIKNIRSTSINSDVNIQHFLVVGHVRKKFRHIFI